MTHKYICIIALRANCMARSTVETCNPLDPCPKVMALNDRLPLNHTLCMVLTF